MIGRGQFSKLRLGEVKFRSTNSFSFGSGRRSGSTWNPRGASCDAKNPCPGTGLTTPLADRAFISFQLSRFGTLKQTPKGRRFAPSYTWTGRILGRNLWRWKSSVRGVNDATESKPYHFKRKLKTSEFGRPFLEQYESSEEYFFGCFDLCTVMGTSLVEGIVRFISRTITPEDTIAVEHIFPRKAKNMERAEDRRLVKALKYARAHGVATERKEQDRYICQICKFDFSTAYPGLGSKFAEAHHKVPLNRAKGARVTVTPNSFLTLCANCHRMVHRAETLLQGNPVDRVAHALKPGQLRQGV